MKKLLHSLRISFLSKKGFSLVELSVVITVAAAATVGTMAWTQPSLGTNSSKANVTNIRMQEIQKAIESFRAIKKRLPCPADPLKRSDGTRASIGTDYLTPTGTAHDYYPNEYGMEDLDNIQTTVNGTTTLGVDCPVSVGSVPVYSLGLDDSYISDAWGRRFTYHVASSICGTDAGTESGLSNVESENIGCNEISYKNNSGNITVTNGVTTLTTTAAFALVSHGVNGYGAFLPSGVKLSASANANEAENSNGDSTYIKANTSSTFDDLVVFETKNQIESLVNRKGVDAKGGVRHISVADCEANGQALRNTSLAETNTILTQFNSLNLANYQQNASNIADQGMLGILKATQSICISYYGATAATINGQTWSGGQCPGTANVTSGSTYDAATDSCLCASGLWDGNCTLALAVALTPSTPVTTGLQIQYDASDALTLFTDISCTGLPSNGNSIGCWKDKSGNARDATSSTTKPTYVSSNATFGNKPSLHFNGSNTKLGFDPLFLRSTSYTIFIVDARGANPGGYMVSTDGDWGGCGAWNNALHYGYDLNTSIRFGQFNNDLDMGIAGYSSTAPWMHRLMLNTASGRSINAHYSGSDHTTSNGATSTLCSLMYANSGSVGSTGGNYYNGDISEVIMYNRALSGGEITSVETYLKSKWNIP